ncbi:MAG TPA: hypothetical protein VI588_01120 [Candidatus Gracilibacteria bacterium]|nr:hypothetical protein [Candidatus Gracilibacteria bacterium]
MPLKSREIIREAWEFTQRNKKMIIWYAFVPSLLTTLTGMLYLVYQYFAFRSSPLFENWEQSFTTLVVTNVLSVIRDNFSTTLPLIIAAVIIGILYIFIPSFCEGAIIQLVARRRNGQDVRTRDGIRHGFLSFLPLFEYSWIIRTFSLVSFLTWAAFVARNLGWAALNTFAPIFIICMIVGVILTIIFTYTEFFIVIDDRKVIESIAKSSVLVVTHLEETILLSILMIIISLRIIIQIVFVLLIPIVVTAVIYGIASAALPTLALVVGGLIGLILLYIASYLSGTIHVFASTVWTFTFLELTGQEYINARGGKVNWQGESHEPAKVSIESEVETSATEDQ